MSRFRSAQRLARVAAVCLAIAMTSAAAAADEEENLIQGGDFAGEVGKINWADRLGTILPSNRPGAAAGEMMFVTETDGPVWKATRHTAAIPAGTTRLVLNCIASGTGLTPPAAQPWRSAQFQVSINDRYGRTIQDWQSIDLPLGDSDWAPYSKEIDCPPDAATAVIYVGNNHVQGVSRFASLSLTAKSADGTSLVPMRESQTDTRGWYPSLVSPDAPAEKSVIDLSRFLHTPAGKHGFVGVEKGRFHFEDGTPARFWGVNIGAENCFPDSATAQRVAASLAKRGVNMVRLHHMDAPWSTWNIFTPGGQSEGKPTTELSPESLERLDYFIAQLKARGIYIYLDLLVHRRVTEAEMSGPVPPNGLKIVGLFNRRAIELQKQYAAQLLTHRNRHTGLRYVDDPAIAMSELINESTFFDGFNGVPDVYVRELEALFDAHCAARNIARPAGAANALLGAKDPVFSRFLVETQIATWDELKRHLRSLGYRVPIAGTNWNPTFGNQQANATLDYIDAHGYWDHPNGGWHWSTQEINNTPLVGAEAGGVIDETSRSRIDGMPFIVTEWNHCFPNAYAAEGPLLWAAAASVQDWDGALQFAYGSTPAGSAVIDNAFDIALHPAQVAAAFPAALLFHRRDIAPAATMRLAPLSVPDDRALAEKSWDALPRGKSFSERLALTRDAVPETPTGTSSAAVRADPSQLRVVIETPHTVGTVGVAPADGAPISLGPVQIQQHTPFAVLTVSSLDEAPIANSRRLLVTGIARAENTGMVMNAARSRVLKIGSLPVLMEPVEATLTIARPGPARAIVLDSAGVRTDRTLPLEPTPDGLRLHLRTEGSPWVEIEFDAP